MAWSRRAVLAAIVVAAVVIGVVVAVIVRSSGSPVTAPPSPVSSAPSSSSSSAPGFVGSWAVAMQKSDNGFRDETLRQIVRTSIGGDALRVRISNEFGSAPLTVRNVRVAPHTGNGQVDPAAARAITFEGDAATTVAVGSAVTSDAVEFAVPADAELAISFYLPEASGAATLHELANRTNYVTGGDQAAAARLSGNRTVSSYNFLTAVDVENTAAAGAVVALGASITDGFHSTFGGNQRWTDLLAARLAASKRTVGVLNAGISGNELTKNGASESALRRFDRDVLGQAGVRWVIFSDDALNDLGDSDPPSAGDLTAAIRQLSDRSHAAGVKFLCSTLTPFEGADYWSQQGEQGRAAVNDFLRTPASGCDGLIDQDAALHDPAAPTRYNNAYNSGDNLHPNDAGMKAIADAVDLALFD